MDAANIAKAIDDLTADEIRGRLSELSAQEKSLRVLLRAKLAADHAKPRASNGCSLLMSRGDGV